ncbi:hypothetical protein [Clostridium sp. ZBS17]|uniref:hypothetical protein n=1 Tax=Clostridium sp. ZBS17 TaxID=2949968 RepID=UPI0020792EB7|nr:hypothetical protein [Clostridium sp. ZBS17]
MILAIDPGNIESGFVYLNDDLSIADKGKIDNKDLLECIESEDFDLNSHIAIEMIASYGMPVGAEVFETCVWIGRYMQALKNHFNKKPKFIYRKDEKMNICQSMKANDATIKQALVDRFAKGQKNYGKGTKKEPGFFYGFKADIWAAYAVAVTYHDMYIKQNCK